MFSLKDVHVILLILVGNRWWDAIS